MTGDRLRDEIARIPSVRSHTATFVGMVDGFAMVNTGDTQITIPCIGYYPPIVGDAVQVEWRNGRAAVVGPAVTRSPLGEITGTGSPRAEVTVDGEPFLLPYRDGYTPVMADTVEVNWATGVIQGALSVAPVAPEAPGSPGAGSTPFDITVRANNSGRYDTSYSSWWGQDPWASDNNDGIWVYGNDIRDSIGATATFTSISIFLPLLQQLGSCSIGVHAHAAIPGGAPTISFLSALSPRGGWVPIDLSYAPYLAVGGRGIGVTSPSGGLNRWTGVSDAYSGALRFTGTR